MGGAKSGCRDIKDKRTCNICKKPFKTNNKFARFCGNCKHSVVYKYAEAAIYTFTDLGRNFKKAGNL